MFLIQDDEYKITNGGQGKRVRRMSLDEANLLKKSVETALNNSTDGRKYIKDLIERAALNTKSEIISVDILDLFKRSF